MSPGQFGYVADDSLFVVTPIVAVCNCSMIYCMLLYVVSNYAIILKGKRESWIPSLVCLPDTRDCCAALPLTVLVIKK